ncbi:hypothetical protein KXW14_008910 [Aspergillus fumigatus]|nr:hypothetical protein KXX47_007543 [Aspergillus fumigatus]KAH2240305.1 hypothetical protein KXW14_008910 [Aspergillus fumigatus]
MDRHCALGWACPKTPWGFLSPWPYPGDIVKELQIVEETLADVRKIKDMANKVISEASDLEQHLSARRELLSDECINESCITSDDTASIRTPEAGSRNAHEIRPPRESEITAYLNVEDANTDIQSSRFANSAPPKHDVALVLPTKGVQVDLSEEHPNGSNTQSLQTSLMDRGSTPLGRTDRSNPAVNASPRGTSIANIIKTPDTESITSKNERRYMPVLFHRLATAINDQQNERIIRWSEDGNTVVIVNEQELTTKLLPAFNITNYFSFTQQLEKLGFRRVEQGYEHSISDAKSPKVRSTQFEGTTERLCRHLLRIIKRSGPQTSQIYGRLALSQCRKCWRATTVYGLPQATYSLRAQDMVPRAVLFLVESTIGWSNEEENQRLRMRTEQFSD